MNKNIILVITVLILVYLLQIAVSKYESKMYRNFRNNKIEKFETLPITTIKSFEPQQGDSSTIITIEGQGLDLINEVIFSTDEGTNVECLIFDDRTDSKIKILPPSLSELSKTIQEVRDIINRGVEVGLKTNISLIGSMGQKQELAALKFYYIDKINYIDNCPKLEEPTTINEDEVINLEQEVILNKETPGSDMEFIKEILPRRLEELNNLIVEQEATIKRYNEIKDGNDEDYLNQILALNALENLKKEYNIQRYNIHQTMKERYNYSF